MRYLLVLLFLLSSYSCFADIEEYPSLLRKHEHRTDAYPLIAKALIEDGYFYSAIPYLKMYLAGKGKKNKKLFNRLLDETVLYVGIKQFEVLPDRLLRQSNGATIKYILAKKKFSTGKYGEALLLLKGIPDSHGIAPYAIHLKATIYALKDQHQDAVKYYQRCMEVTDKVSSEIGGSIRIRQLNINRDYCLLGKARTYFAMKKFDKAQWTYLDVSKKSPVWPEILFEEAWTSFYLKDYNRTLGKLVTYNAPILNYVFNPETDVLQALTFMELCLWDDAKKSVAEFYDKYFKQVKKVGSYLKRNQASYQFFYKVVDQFQNGSRAQDPLIRKYLASLTRDGAFHELNESLKTGYLEVKRILKNSTGSTQKKLLLNVKETISFQKKLIGAYAYRRMKIYHRQLIKALEGMSYIKLEIIAQRKNMIYMNKELDDTKRGDIKYLKRNDKQYFWNFIGEFWADELGDYVFALKSECQE